MISLTFTGIGAAYNPALGNTAAYFIKDSHMYLIDCGGTVFPALMERRAFDGMDGLTVFITHTHADHAGSLGTLISYCQGVLNMDVAVAHPSAHIQTLLRASGIAESRYTFFPDTRFSCGQIEAAFYPVSHTQALPSFGILLSDETENVYYSGDAGDMPEEIAARFARGEIARAYQDAALLNDGTNKAHGSYARFLNTIPQPLRARFFPIHWDTDMRKAILADGFGLAM